MKTKVYMLRIETYKWFNDEKNYRIILLDSEVSFYKLHLYIQKLFGFDQSHLFEFKKDKKIKIYGNLGDYEEFENGPFAKGKRDFAGISYMVKLKDFFDKKKTIDYLYDFGDNWYFKITKEKTLELDKKEVPKVIGGKGYFLLEDSGGYYGLFNYIESYEKKDFEFFEDFGFENLEQVKDYLEPVLSVKDFKDFDLGRKANFTRDENEYKEMDEVGVFY